MKKIYILSSVTIMIILLYIYINNGAYTKKEEMPKIIDIIIGNNYYIALCEDKSVWSWGSDKSVLWKEEYKNGKLGLGEITETKVPIKIKELSNIVKILDVGSCIYALSEDGFIYGWGENYQNMINTEKLEGSLHKPSEVFATPIKLSGLENIKSLEARNQKAFALDNNGKFYVWGIGFSNGIGMSIEDMIPGFPEEHRHLVEDIDYIKIGAGNYNYFIKSDGTVMSILEYLRETTSAPDGFIFPRIQDDRNIDELKDFVVLNKSQKFSTTLLYELSGVKGVEKISSDSCTVFIYKKDGTLWYWDSDKIKFHDNINGLKWIENVQEHEGIFDKVSIRSIFGIHSNDIEMPKIIDMKSSRDNTMFLTDTGEVFVSFYKTYDVEDVGYSRDPEHWVVIENMELRKLEFKKLDMKNIVSINVDGNKDEDIYKYADAYYSGSHDTAYSTNFSAVDSDGNYYHWNPNPFHAKYYKNN